jgi:hypothetical protein
MYVGVFMSRETLQLMKISDKIVKRMMQTVMISMVKKMEGLFLMR